MHGTQYIDTMADVSVVVPSRKPTDEIAPLTTTEWASTRGVEVLIQREPSVTAARNEGIRRAAADKLVFLDDDSTPAAGYLSRVSDVLDREAAVAGRTVHPRDDIFKRLADHYDFGETGRYVTRFWGCNMAVRKDVFETVGVWDEHIPWGHEEKELADRVLEAYPIYYEPELVVRHAYADSILGYWRKRYRLETQTPYYWETTGLDDTQKWLEIGRHLCNPTNYVGRSIGHTVARAGGTFASTLGRLDGMRRLR